MLAAVGADGITSTVPPTADRAVAPSAMIRSCMRTGTDFTIQKPGIELFQRVCLMAVLHLHLSSHTPLPSCSMSSEIRNSVDLFTEKIYKSNKKTNVNFNEFSRDKKNYNYHAMSPYFLLCNLWWAQTELAFYLSVKLSTDSIINIFTIF